MIILIEKIQQMTTVTAEKPTHYQIWNSLWIPKNLCEIQLEVPYGEYDLPEILAGILLTLMKNPELEYPTIDEVFEFMEIPMEDRSDFTWTFIQSLVLVRNSE